MQQLTRYGIPMTCVVPDLDSRPVRFQVFAREMNPGWPAPFFSSREDAT